MLIVLALVLMLRVCRALRMGTDALRPPAENGPGHMHGHMHAHMHGNMISSTNRFWVLKNAFACKHTVCLPFTSYT